jgi:hypothetical protein
MLHAFKPPETCPVCGTSVPPRAKACPDCGADERSGWDDEATRYDGLDLPDAAYDDEREHTPVPRTKRDYAWLALTVLVLFAVILTFLFH